MHHAREPRCDGHEPQRESQRGTSLVELTVLLVAAALLVGSTLSGVVSHGIQRRIHGEQILAMSACRNTLETLRSVPFTTLPSFHGTGFDVPGQDGQPRGLSPVPGDLDGLPGEISVQLNRQSGGAILYTVTARARWLGATRGGDFKMTAVMGERR
jgi:hypothetical protein